MRVVGWIAAFAVVAALGAGLYSSAHRATLTASHLAQSSNVLVGSSDNKLADPPHIISPQAAGSTSAPRAPSKPPAPPSSSGGPAPIKPPSVVIGSRQQQLINADRAAHGLGPLSWSGCLYNVAVANARRIAAQEYLSHTNGPSVDLNCRLGNRAGENIGYWSLGINDPQLNTMFMNSPDHYANIMGPYHYVATAWVVGANGYGYIAVEFS